MRNMMDQVERKGKERERVKADEWSHGERDAYRYLLSCPFVCFLCSDLTRNFLLRTSQYYCCCVVLVVTKMCCTHHTNTSCRFSVSHTIYSKARRRDAAAAESLFSPLMKWMIVSSSA